MLNKTYCKMAEEDSSSKHSQVFVAGYNICLIISAISLLVSYQGTSVYNVDVGERLDTLKVKLRQYEAVSIRSKRSVSFDDAFSNLNNRLDSLEKRFAKNSPIVHAEKSSFGALLPFLRGRRGPPGAPGEKGDPGLQGKKGKSGRKGDIGPPSERTDHISSDETGRSLYIRWGRKSCPKETGAELVYSGRSAGQHSSHAGGISNTLCLHGTPEYAKYSDSANTKAWIYIVEYKVSSFNPFTKPLNNFDAPCAVCQVKTRGNKLMLPGRNTCPTGWTTEYKGYLMSEKHNSQGRTSPVCVDEGAEPIPGTVAGSGGSAWHLVQGVNNPYLNGRELTCTVCTR